MADTEFSAGELIENRYRVLTVIGSGGMGTLYRVSDEARDGEMVALKMLKLSVLEAEKSEWVERFQREFQLLTQLCHPNLVSVYDYGVTTEEELYFTMEWVQGQDLESLLRLLAPKDTIPLIVQICRALAYLHARDVIHGDLKPSNILVTGDQVKIVDFGVALEIRSPQVRSRYYTPGYAAPEIKQGRLDHLADLYSLGAVWYALLIGEPPMFMHGAEQLIRFTLEETLAAQQEIPVAVGAIISRLLSTSPTERYASANEVIAAVNEATGSTYALETRETARSYALRGRFVGRGAEMAVLRGMWGQVRSGESKLVLISGEMGVGKTRLVEEFVVQAELEGARVTWGQCVESGGSAYHPWREVLRVLIRYVEGAVGPDLEMKRIGAILALLLPELWQRAYMTGVALPAELEPQAAQQRLNDAIAQVVCAAARLRPTVIVIENAHWADEATLKLLSFLARIPGQAGLLVCVTYRDDEVGPEHPLATLTGSRIARIPLRGLETGVTADLARSMLGLEQLPDLLSQRVQETTGGNVYFVQELIRSLVEDGVVLQRTVKGWQVNTPALQTATLPGTIRQVVLRRLGRLPPGERETLQRAAVVGPVFWGGILAHLGQVAVDEVEVALRGLREKKLVVERESPVLAGEREYGFLQATLREVAYESVPEPARTEYHVQVAGWLEARVSDQTTALIPLIAHHYEQGAVPDKAAEYLQRAGEQAAAQFASAAAVSYLSRALALTPEDNSERRYALLLAREKIYDGRGDRAGQRQDLASLMALAEAMADDRRRAEVALRRAHYADVTGDYTTSVAAAQEAIALARNCQAADLEAAGFVQWGKVLWLQGDYKLSQCQLEQALTLARAAQLRQAEVGGLSFLGLVCVNLGDYTGAAGYFNQALRLCRETNDRRGEGNTLNSLGLLYRDLGDYTSATAYFEQALHIIHEIGARLGEGRTRGNLGLVCWKRGDYAGAIRHFEQILQIFREIGDPESESETLVSLAMVFQQLNDNETAREYSQQALDISREIHARPIQGYALHYLGNSLAGLGNWSEAAAAYRQALALRQEMGELHLAIEPLAGLARVSLALGNIAQAQAQVEEILRFLEHNTLDGTDDPFRVYLTCVRVLSMAQDPRAQEVLVTAYNMLQEQAAKIHDEAMRRMFLENVPAHREIIREFEERIGQGRMGQAHFRGGNPVARK